MKDMKKRKKRKKKKKLTKDEREYIKNISLTGYPFLDGILAIAFVLFMLKIAPPYISVFFGN
uniref:Uncharacterized protein n=1 Tax=uncultured Alphaproteobacteria bacterium TaxID=91750 RepID=A0A1B0Z2D6_9PROT|nr:hypothetical protein [uncultured Alphaproteobacteria bacterium]ANO58367.1 hypothetical protein [uncultured Alphaproteobacteria bacterium]